MKVTVIGAGLAGSEAAWQVAKQEVPVTLFEMRPHVMTPAHKTGLFAELVCSNSLRGASIVNAVGLLKEEMKLMDSLIMKAAVEHQLPAGGALAVDRERFSQAITTALAEHPLVEIKREEVTEIPDGIVIIATGPLTSHKLSETIKQLTGQEYLYFYDAAAPIVMADSINYDKVFRASRYGKGDADYLNCPLTEEEYRRFYEALLQAELTPLREFEDEKFFEGCMPVEQLAKRGYQTLAFGPMKPVGLIDPKTGKEPFAVVQLRQDNQEGTLYNMVGFQTHLKWPDQKRIFRMIPGLEEAEFARFGVMHRNTYINAPKILRETLQMKSRPTIFFAGQITGVEGYVESASSGLVAGVNAGRLAKGLEPLIFPKETAIGGLCHYIHTASPENFQPMNVNFGLLPALERKVKSKWRRNTMLAERALETLQDFIKKKLR